MVGAVGGIAEQGTGVIDRRYQGYIREVGAAAVGIVEDHHIPGVEGQMVDGLLDGERHGAEMDGDMGGLGDHIPVGVEQGAGEIPPFLDIGGIRGFLQHGAHLFRDGGEDMLEDFELDWVVIASHSYWPTVMIRLR